MIGRAIIPEEAVNWNKPDAATPTVTKDVCWVSREPY